MRLGRLARRVRAELVLQAMIDLDNYEKAIVITGDGDFHCLVDYLYKKQKLEALLIPNKYRCSALLKLKKFRKKNRFMSDLQAKLQDDKRKAP
jgi:hypothetical protein